MAAMVSEETKDAMNQTFDNVNRFAESSVNAIKEYYVSTRVGKATVDAEQWMEREATAAQRRVEASFNQYYNEAVARRNEQALKKTVDLDLEKAQVPTLHPVTPVTAEMQQAMRK